MATTIRIVERKRGKEFIRITAELRENHPTLSDGFSVTAELWEPRGAQSGYARRNRDADVYGCQHETVVMFAPELAPLVAVHLADPDGVPMHAVANGWYFYSGQARDYERKHYSASYAAERGTSHERAAQALNIPPADLPEGMDKAQFEAFAESLRPRWAAMAAQARALLESLPDVYEVRDYDMYGKANR